MKKNILMALVAFLSTAIYAQNSTLSIKGTTPKDAKWVHYFVNGQVRKGDSLAVKNGKFELKLQETEGAFVTLATKVDDVMTIVGDKTPVTIDFVEGTIQGSEQNLQFVALQKDFSKQDKKIMEVYQNYKNIAAEKTPQAIEQQGKLRQELENLEKKQMEQLINFALSNKKSIVPAYYLGQMYHGMSYETLNKLLDKDAAYYAHPMMEAPKKQLSFIEKRRPGITFTDLEMNDLQGNPVKLSQWVGKGNYVLVDFWASWCGPCRMEMPNVVAAYHKYHNEKGFDVVGVSFDSKQEAWAKGVADLCMPWHNMSDLKGWKCAAADIYGIRSIPSNILVNPQGKIVACDLRGAALEKTLKEIYGF